jgi:hypothetical protein
MIGATVILTAILPASPATATPIFFTSRSAFDENVGPQKLVTFEGLLPGPVCLPTNPFVPDPCQLTVHGVAFSATTGIPIVNQRPELSTDGVTAIGSNAIPTAPGDFSLTFGGHFIGLDVLGGGGLPVVPFAFLFTEADGHQASLSLITGLTSFLGARSDVGFGQLSIYSASTTPGASSNFTVANIAIEPTPDPATFLLFATAGVGLGLTRCYRRRERAHGT